MREWSWLLAVGRGAVGVKAEQLLSASDETSQQAALDALGRLLAQDVAELVGPDGQKVRLPEAARRALAEAARILHSGHAVAVVPVHAELSTQEAADLLNVSRQYLVRLLDQEKIPYSRTGTHRRLRLDDVIAFERQRSAKRREGLKRLTRASEDLRLYEY